jgi:hypothetical protein
MTPLKLKALVITKVEDPDVWPPEARTRVECWRYRPTELGARLAAADVRWLQMRNPRAEYQLEAIEWDKQLVLEADDNEAPPQTEVEAVTGRLAEQGERADHTLPEERR